MVGAQTCPHHKFREFEKLVFFSFQQINFKRGNSTNLKAIFAAELADFP